MKGEEHSAEEEAGREVYEWALTGRTPQAQRQKPEGRLQMALAEAGVEAGRA